MFSFLQQLCLGFDLNDFSVAHCYVKCSPELFSNHIGGIISCVILRLLAYNMGLKNEWLGDILILSSLRLSESEYSV